MDERRRALVLGSGGLTGLAWQAGVLAGLADAGVRLDADLVVGTSAGALLGARLAGGEPIGDVVDALRTGRALRPEVGPPPSGSGDGSFPVRGDGSFLVRGDGSFPVQVDRASTQPGGSGGLASIGVVTPGTVARLLAAQLYPDRRAAIARLGRRAAREWTPDASARWAEAAAGDLAGRVWPASLRVVVTAVETGRPVVLGARRPADLADAVAASCAMPGVFPAVPVGGRLCFDGGLRSPANLDVAGAADVVLALAPLTGAVRAHRRPGVQAARLRASGSSVVLLTPDASGRRAIGVDVLAAGRVPACLDAGRALGRARVADVLAAWR